jgi:uncharacterized protein with HEPN domain
MDIEIKAWLYDILNAINEIDSFLIGSIHSFEAYQADIKTKRAIERNIENNGRGSESYHNKRFVDNPVSHKKNCRYQKQNYTWV